MAATPPSPADWAISTVAAAQICQSVGFRRAEPAALRHLSDLLGRYLRSLAGLAAANANSHGRTDSNLLDVVHATELLHCPRGFPGAADPQRPLLRSAVLKGIASFVSLVDEIPFAQPLRRRDRRWGRGTAARVCFQDIGTEPPGPHVPRWLPAFSDAKAPVLKSRRGEASWPDVGGCGEANDGGATNERMTLVGRRGFFLLPKERRERVRFKIAGVEMRSRGEEIGSGRRGGKRVLNCRGDEEEEESCFGAVRKLRMCDGRVCAPLALDVSSAILD